MKKLPQIILYEVEASETRSNSEATASVWLRILQVLYTLKEPLKQIKKVTRNNLWWLNTTSIRVRNPAQIEYTLDCA